MTARRFRSNRTVARRLWGTLPATAIYALKELTTRFSLSAASGDLLFLNERWYVTHTGLLQLATRKHCAGIRTSPEKEFCNPAANRWAFKAVVYKTPTCRGFVGYGDADPSNVSPLVHGAEMRVAETRAVNRALRKAYGIGICSVEEIGSFAESAQSSRESKKFPPQPHGKRKLQWTQGPRPPLPTDPSAPTRRQSRQVIRRRLLWHQTLREATREQVENFVAHLADWAEKDRNALLCQLNSYLGSKEGAA